MEYEIRVQIRIQHPRVSMCTNFGRDIPIISLKNLHDNKFQIQIPHTQLSIGTNFGKNIQILALKNVEKPIVAFFWDTLYIKSIPLYVQACFD